MKIICSYCNNAIYIKDSKTRIIDLLSEKPNQTVSQIAKQLNLSRVAVYYQLSKMNNLKYSEDKTKPGYPKYIMIKND